jgi:hypothetical protein
MSEERRRFPRIAIESTDLKLATSVGNQPKVPIDRIVDFSRGGLRIEISAAVPVPKIGSLMDVSLEWSGGSGRFDASVRHVEKSGSAVHIGIEFDDPELVEKLIGPWLRQAAM